VCSHMVPTCRLGKNIRKLKNVIELSLFIWTHAIQLELLLTLLQNLMLQSTDKSQGI
jgi:hypothetical protein